MLGNLIEIDFVGGEGPPHYGVCSNYLQDIEVGEDICMFIRR